MTERIHDIWCGGTLLGTAYYHGVGRGLTTSFDYSADWLSDPGSFPIAPSMPLSKRSYHFSSLPPFLTDAAPDRWGRRLIQRGELESAGEERRRPHQLDDVDFLERVDDWSRMGALQLAVPGREGFLAAGSNVPRLIELPELAASARAVTAGAPARDELKALLDAGSSSLGGGRPKATVKDGGRLFIAKFPAAGDDWDVLGWEAWALEVCRRAGLTVPEKRLVAFEGRHILLVERFDREEDRRIPFISAMTLLDARDGERFDYADMADALTSFVSSPARELETLFLRACIGVVINDTDDHLRNHGFVRHAGRWGTSPAYDVNPNPYSDAARATSVYGHVGHDALDGLWDLAAHLGLSDSRALSLQKRVYAAMGDWPRIARDYGIPAQEISFMGSMLSERVDQLRRCLSAYEQEVGASAARIDTPEAFWDHMGEIADVRAECEAVHGEPGLDLDGPSTDEYSV